MPTHDRLGLDDGNGIKDARATAIKPNEQSAVDPTQMRCTAWRTLLQDIKLMSQSQDFSASSRRRVLKQSHRGRLPSFSDHVLIRC